MIVFCPHCQKPVTYMKKVDGEQVCMNCGTTLSRDIVEKIITLIDDERAERKFNEKQL
jgi:predicted amidophosphoribosyltransferase